jgi:hypothetical protein
MRIALTDNSDSFQSPRNFPTPNNPPQSRTTPTNNQHGLLRRPPPRRPRRLQRPQRGHWSIFSHNGSPPIPLHQTEPEASSKSAAQVFWHGLPLQTHQPAYPSAPRLRYHSPHPTENCPRRERRRSCAVLLRRRRRFCEDKTLVGERTSGCVACFRAHKQSP